MVRFTSIASIFLVTCGVAWCFTGSGGGTEVDPYIITNVYQLQGVSDELDAHYVLGNDIDASDTVNWNDGQGFEPVGTLPGNIISPFSGKFDGKGHAITALFIDRPMDNSIGLFRAIGTGSQIINLVLSDVDITGYKGTGSVVGSFSGGIVDNCKSSGKVKCIYWYGGGFVGAMAKSVTITNCSSSCSVSGYRYTGGFCGSMQGTTIKCHASGDVFGEYGFTGGFVGNSRYGSMSQCYATGNVTSILSNAGGFMGATTGIECVIDECYATGNIVSNSNRTGGFIGTNTAVITNCYATGSARGAAHIGGFVGFNESSLQNCYSTGKVTSSSSDSRIGGLCGSNNSTINNCYYDTQTSGRSDVGKGIPKTTDLMMQETTFIEFDFDDVWYVVEYLDYPIFQWMLPPITISVDIMPDSCPNPLDISSRGVLPVAVLGMRYFDVFEIDVASVRLMGVAPFRSYYEDVSTLTADPLECDGISQGPDGFIDLTLKFDKKKVIKALRGLKGVPNGTDVPLTLTLKLLVGDDDYQGEDCVKIIKPKPPQTQETQNQKKTESTKEEIMIHEN